MHRTPLEYARTHGAVPDSFGRLELPRRRNETEERLSVAERRGLIPSAAAFRPVFDALPDAWTPRLEALVHGDLYARHLLLDPKASPCGVIDWGDVHLGDPAVDLALIHGFLPPRAHAEFRANYGPIDDDTWRMARFKATHHVAATLVYADDVGDAALARESAVAVRHILGN